jgi:hypothetical protein
MIGWGNYALALRERQRFGSLWLRKIETQQILRKPRTPFFTTQFTLL